ncbi:MAG: sulfatase-like hydrolase/transferase, partial [Pseudomonadota bacterium]
MNILLMIADDLGRMIGCYGEPKINTPRIDRLAAEGTRFDMAFTSTASCSASRSVIFTGLHTHETGQYGLHHDHHHFMTFADVATAPALLNESGWHTGIIGKVHVGPETVYPWITREESASRDVAWVADRARAYFADRRADAKPFFLTIGFIDPHRDETRGGFGNETCGAEGPMVSPDEVAVPPFLTDLPEVRQELADYYRSVHRLDR